MKYRQMFPQQAGLLSVSQAMGSAHHQRMTSIPYCFQPVTCPSGLVRISGRKLILAAGETTLGRQRGASVLVGHGAQSWHHFLSKMLQFCSSKHCLKSLMCRWTCSCPVWAEGKNHSATSGWEDQIPHRAQKWVSRLCHRWKQDYKAINESGECCRLTERDWIWI